MDGAATMWERRLPWEGRVADRSHAIGVTEAPNPAGRAFSFLCCTGITMSRD